MIISNTLIKTAAVAIRGVMKKNNVDKIVFINGEDDLKEPWGSLSLDVQNNWLKVVEETFKTLRAMI